LAVLAVATALGALAAFIALVWTLGQSAAYLFRGRANASGPAPQSLAPIHERFARNFRRTIIQLPLLIVT